MADQQSASDIEQIAATSNENGLNTNEDDYSPSIDQILESKQLAKERGIRIKELEIQIAQLNARLDTESHKAGTVYDRKGQEKKQLEKTIGQLEDDVRKVKRERDQLHNRLVSTKKYGVAVLLLSLMLVSMILFQLLSDCLTGKNNDTVVSTDLEPGKLSQDYRGIYDQDYTMAYVELEEQKDTVNVRETVRTFLDILKVAHELAEEYSMKHLVSMNQSVTSLLIEQPDTDSQDKKRHAWVNITLSPMELQDFYKIRQSSAWRMRENITEKLGEVVAERFRIDAESQPMMMTYVKNCVTLCWKANMRWDPVYIDFREPEAGIEFNFTLYRPFLHQTGSNLDYVVWPPMFEKRGGKLIAKGIAEKMD